MELTDIKELYRNRGEYIGREVTIGGWVRSNRDSKNFGPCLEVSTIIFRSRPTPKTLLKAWK